MLLIRYFTRLLCRVYMVVLPGEREMIYYCWDTVAVGDVMCVWSKLQNKHETFIVVKRELPALGGVPYTLRGYTAYLILEKQPQEDPSPLRRLATIANSA